MVSVMLDGDHAVDLPSHWKHSSEISDKQFGYTDVSIDENGKVSIGWIVERCGLY